MFICFYEHPADVQGHALAHSQRCNFEVLFHYYLYILLHLIVQIFWIYLVQSVERTDDG